MLTNCIPPFRMIRNASFYFIDTKIQRIPLGADKRCYTPGFPLFFQNFVHINHDLFRKFRIVCNLSLIHI